MSAKTSIQLAREKTFQADQRVVFLTTLPLKLALAEVARRHQQSISDVIRRVLIEYTDQAYPGYQEIYTKNVLNLIEGDR